MSSPAMADGVRPGKAKRQTQSQEMAEMGLDPMGDIRDLGHEFRDGRLFKVGSDERFKFQNQEHYDRLADATVAFVALLLEDEGDLQPLWLPLGVGHGDGCPVFVSDNFETAKRLLIIMNGSGRVRAGVWSCFLCINESFDQGTALPFVKEANKRGYGVIVCNSNANVADGEPIKGSETPEKHLKYVWEHLAVGRCAAAEVDIVAHSAGGRSVVNLMRTAYDFRRPDGTAPTIRRIAFTDSYHAKGQLALLPDEAIDLLRNPARTVNFVPHTEPVGTPVEHWTSEDYSMTSLSKGCMCVSAGVTDHEKSSFAAKDHIFAFLDATGDRDPSVLCNGEEVFERTLSEETLARVRSKPSIVAVIDESQFETPIGENAVGEVAQERTPMEGNAVSEVAGNDTHPAPVKHQCPCSIFFRSRERTMKESS